MGFSYSPTPSRLVPFHLLYLPVLVTITLLSCSCFPTPALCHLLSYLYLPIPMLWSYLLSYSHAHASAVLLQFPIPQTFFNSLPSYSPRLILLLSCCPVLLLSAYSPTRILLLLLFYSFAVIRILPAPSLLSPLDYPP